MRLSTNQLFEQGISAIIQQQTALQETELRMASGKNILTPSDDPATAVRVVNLESSINKVEHFTSNINAARTELSQQEEVLKLTGNSLHRARELILQANNDTLDSSNRRAIAGELNTIRDELIALANTQDASGEYIFAGAQVNGQPFGKSGDQVIYSGDQAQRMMQVGAGIQMVARDSGHDVFRNIKAGNGAFEVRANDANGGGAVVNPSGIGQFVQDSYQVTFVQLSVSTPMTYEVRDSSSALIASGNYLPEEAIDFAGVRLEFSGEPENGDTFDVTPSQNRDVFTVIQNSIDVLNANAAGSSSDTLMHNRLIEVMDDLDQSMSHILDRRAVVGSRLNSLDTQQNVHDNNMLQLQTSLSGLTDLDYSEAINELNLRLTALQAAQQAYIRIQGMTLFNHI